MRYAHSARSSKKREKEKRLSQAFLPLTVLRSDVMSEGGTEGFFKKNYLAWCGIGVANFSKGADGSRGKRMETKRMKVRRVAATKKVLHALEKGVLRFVEVGRWVRRHGKWSSTPEGELYGDPHYRVFSAIGDDMTLEVGLAYPGSLKGIRRRGFRPHSPWVQFGSWRYLGPEKGLERVPRQEVLNAHLKDGLAYAQSQARFMRW